MKIEFKFVFFLTEYIHLEFKLLVPIRHVYIVGTFMLEVNMCLDHVTYAHRCVRFNVLLYAARHIYERKLTSLVSEIYV